MESLGWSDDEQPPAAAGAPRPGSQQRSQTEEEHREALNFSFGEPHVRAAAGDAQDVTWWATGCSEQEIAGRFAVLQQLHLKGVALMKEHERDGP